MKTNKSILLQAIAEWRASLTDAEHDLLVKQANKIMSKYLSKGESK